MTQLQYSRQEVVATLRRTGFAELADEALRVLPDPVDIDQIEAFCRQHNLNQGRSHQRDGRQPVSRARS